MVVGRKTDIVIVIVIVIGARGPRETRFVHAAHLLLKSEIRACQEGSRVGVLFIEEALAVARGGVEVLHQHGFGKLLRFGRRLAIGDSAVAGFIGDSVQKVRAVVGNYLPRVNSGVNKAVDVRALVNRDFQHRPPRITVVIIHGDGVFPAFQLCVADIDRQRIFLVYSAVRQQVVKNARLLRDGISVLVVAVALGHGDVPYNGIFPFLGTVGSAHERFFQQAALDHSRNVVIGAAREAHNVAV